MCGEKGFFLRVNQEGICFTCESKNSSLLYRNNIQIEETNRKNPLTSFNNDYYVYAWKIKDTGEIFYIGKGRGDRAYGKHDRAYEAEKIRTQYETVVEILKDNLSEEEALEYESTEIKRILNETTHRLIELFRLILNVIMDTDLLCQRRLINLRHRLYYLQVKLMNIILKHSTGLLMKLN